MANPHRATVVVKLGPPGKQVEHELCLNNDAIASYEAEFRNADGTLGNFLQRASAAKLFPFGTTECIALIHLGLGGAGKKVSRDAVKAFVAEMRSPEIFNVALAAVNAALQDPEPNPPQEGASPSRESPGGS